MIRQEQLGRFDEVIRRARAAGNTEVLTETVDLLARALRQAGADTTEPAVADPITRAHARAHEAVASPQVQRAGTSEEPCERGQPMAGALHKLRKGRDRCGATRRDGEPCEAPAIENGLVCRRHGGAAPQVAIAAEYQGKQMAAYVASREFTEARGTPREFDALCRALRAGRDLDAHEVKLRLLGELKAEARRKRATRGTVRTP
jgi:hypothetical protein